MPYIFRAKNIIIIRATTYEKAAVIFYIDILYNLYKNCRILCFTFNSCINICILSCLDFTVILSESAFPALFSVEETDAWKG